MPYQFFVCVCVLMCVCVCVCVCTHSQVIPVVAPTGAIDGIQFVVGERMMHVVVVAPVKHPPGILPQLQSLLLREGPVGEGGDRQNGGHVLSCLVGVGDEQQELRQETPEDVCGRCHHTHAVYQTPPVKRCSYLHQYNARKCPDGLQMECIGYVNLRL